MSRLASLAPRSGIYITHDPDRPLASTFRFDLLDLDSGQDAPMSAGPPHTLSALFPKDADLGATHVSVDDTDDSSVGDEWRSGDHHAICGSDEEHLLEGHFLPYRRVEVVDVDRAAWHDFDLSPAALNDGVHVQPFRRPLTWDTLLRAPLVLPLRV